MVDDVRKIADRMATKGETEVLWMSAGQRDKRLHIAPIDVSASLRREALRRQDGGADERDAQAGRRVRPRCQVLGLEPGDETWSSLDVGSPFDYQQQGMLYVAKDLPLPGRDGLEEAQLAEITALVEASGGRTLGLFSSRRAAERAAEVVRERLPDIDIWCQGDAQLPELARRFAETPSTCLFGTLSLWQGVDLPAPRVSWSSSTAYRSRGPMTR